jgi:hypothetical protein
MFRELIVSGGGSIIEFPYNFGEVVLKREREKQLRL